MQESPIEDNESVHSDESNVSIQKDKLEALINLELKHSGVYYDLHSKDNLLKVDLENLYSSCQRFENQKKKKSELLEEHYEKLMEYQKRNKMQLKEKLSSIMLKLEETNSLFCEAFNDYSCDVLKNSINTFDEKTEQLQTNLIEIKKQLNSFQLKEKINESLMKPKLNQILNIKSAINMLFEFSMKRPEIEIEETILRLTNNIKKLEQKEQEIKSVMNKDNK